MRRALLRGLLAVYGGLPPRRADQLEQSSGAGVAPGTATGTFRGRLVVISGTGPNVGLFVYNGRPGPGNLLASITEAISDQFGNATIPGGLAVYRASPPSAVLIFGNGMFGYTGSLATGWTIGSATITTSGDNWVIAGNAGVSFPQIATPAQVAGAAKLFADNTQGYLRSRPALAGDTNVYAVSHLDQKLALAFTITSTTPQAIFSVPLGVGDYLIEVSGVFANTTAADSAAFAFAFTGTVNAAPQLVKFTSMTSGTATVGYGASSTFTTSFNGQAVAGNQDLRMELTISVATAGTLTLTGAELFPLNTVTVFAGSRMQLRPQ